MLEFIKNIGRVVRRIEGEKEIVDLWQKDSKQFDNLIVIDIDEKNDKVNFDLGQFYVDAYRQSLIYQQGNGHVGSGIKIESFKNTDKEINKIKNKIISCLDFMEIDNKHLDDINNWILKEVEKDKSQSYFVLIKKNDKNPIDLYKDKYEKIIREIYLIEDKSKYKEIKSSVCHLCGNKSKNFDTAVFKCYTNDKEIYENTEKYNYNVCEDCLFDLLNGRKYINDYLKTFWAGSEVMFLPHEFNEEIKIIYEEDKIDQNGKVTKLLENIGLKEEEILEYISKTNCMTDIIFFNDPKSSSEWKVEYSIRDIMPSRFSVVSNNLQKYIYEYNNTKGNLHLGNIMNYLCYSDGKSGSQTKDRMRILDIIFNGNKFSRSLFFNKVMRQYKNDYFKGKKFMGSIHQVYNFMCDCGCLEKGWDLVALNDRGRWEAVKYKNLEEFFIKNEKFFDTQEKKAWFILGKIYNSTIYYSKKNKSNAGENISSESSHLEKNFFFGRKFDFSSFVYFSNLCSEKLTKYGSYYSSIKDEMNTAKTYMQKGHTKLNNDEAKYIFFWGMDMYFDKKEEEV